MLKVLDIQGNELTPADLEIATKMMSDEEELFFFCSGNLSLQAVERFLIGISIEVEER